MKLLILTRYSEMGASSRLRTMQFVPMLRKAGWLVDVQPLLDEFYLSSIYSVRGRFKSLPFLIKEGLRAFVKRFRFLRHVKDYDLIWLEKEMFPYLPAYFEKLLIRRGVKYIVDYDDAIFHNYDRHQSALVKFFLTSKLAGLLKNSGAVTVGNPYLAEYARSHGAQSVHQLPTVIDLARYEVIAEPPPSPFRIGWIGSPSSASYLPLVLGAIRRLAKGHDVVLVTVGAPLMEAPGIRLEQHAWTLEAEARLVQGFHIGIMPLHDTPWERGKCGYKLIQYMACGRPVVASPIGINSEIVTPDVGILASSEDEWLSAFELLMKNSDLRNFMGKSARKLVEYKYNTDVIFPKLDGIFRSCLNK